MPDFGLPSDFPVGSPESRAAMRALIDREKSGPCILFRVMPPSPAQELDGGLCKCRPFPPGIRVHICECFLNGTDREYLGNPGPHGPTTAARILSVLKEESCKPIENREISAEEQPGYTRIDIGLELMGVNGSGPQEIPETQTTTAKVDARKRIAAIEKAFGL